MSLTWLPGRRRGVSLFIFLALCILPTLATADRIVRRDGSVIEGRILSENRLEIAVDVRGVRMTIRQADIERIERVSADQVGPGEAKAVEGQQFLDAGKPVEAWAAFSEMNTREPAALDRHRTRLQRAVMELEKELQRQLSSAQFQQAFDLSTTLASQPNRQLVARIVGAEPAEQFYNRLSKTYAYAAYKLGDEAFKAGEHQKAETLLRQATGLMEPSDKDYDHAQYTLGIALGQAGMRFLAEKDDQRGEAYVREAVRALEAARSSTRNPALKQEAFNVMASLKAEGDQTLSVLRATPTPLPPSPTPTPPPSPTPTPVPGAIDKFMSSSFMVGAQDLLGKVLPEGTDREQALNYVLVGLGVLLIYWLVPWAILKFLSGRADILASKWRPKVKYLGFFTLFGYVWDRLTAGRVKKDKNVKHPCAECGHDLDNFMSYENLDFAHCPNCGAEIAPRHTLEDYLDILAGVLTEDAERADKGAITMQSLVGKDLMQKLIRACITLAVRRRASDLHVEPSERGVVLRHRVDGVMTEMTRLPRSLSNAIVSAIKILGNMDITEKRKPQDGSFVYVVDGQEIDIRAASSPAYGGEKMSLRILDVRTIQKDFKDLGMGKKPRAMFERAIARPHGLVLVTGPTGSGKTTTLYVALQKLATGTKNIVSLEDPIEFKLPGINQTQINSHIGLTFASGLRNVLRQDPDIIMVGEVRDEETAQAAVSAAMTGHLVFSSLHTIDAPSTVARFMDLGVAPRQFCDSLLLIVAQRLIRMVCPECKAPHKPDDAQLEDIDILEKAHEYQFFMGTGCALCNGTGYFGRTGIYEMLEPSEALRAALERGTLVTAEIRQIALQTGMRTLRQEALLLLKEGMTTVEEVLRVTN